MLYQLKIMRKRNQIMYSFTRLQKILGEMISYVLIQLQYCYSFQFFLYYMLLQIKIRPTEPRLINFVFDFFVCHKNYFKGTIVHWVQVFQRKALNNYYIGLQALSSLQLNHEKSIQNGCSTKQKTRNHTQRIMNLINSHASTKTWLKIKTYKNYSKNRGKKS